MYRHQHHHGPSIFNLGGGGTTFNRHNIVKFKTRDPFKTSAIIDPFASNKSTVIDPFVHVNKPTNNVNQPTNINTPTPNVIIDPFVFSVDPVIPAARNKQLPALPLPPKEEDTKFDDVFDFPDTLQTEVKLMVASSTRQIITKSGKKQPKRVTPKKTTSSETKFVKSTLKKKNSNASLKSAAATTNNTFVPMNSTPAIAKDVPMYIPPPLLQQPTEEDIFAFDSNPELKITHRSTRNDINNSYDTTSNNTSFLSFTTSRPYNTQPTSIASILNPLPPQQPPVKRKRNLVAHLKSASGEEIKTCSNLDFLSSDEELELLPIHEIIQKERSVSPELSYAQRMELELESLLKPDTLLSQEEVPAKKRITYQPQNKVPVKITFAKKK